MAKLSPKAKSELYSNFEKYARSAMGMEKACDSLLRQPRVGKTEQQIYEGILSGLRQGKSIGDALGDSSPSVSSLEREVVTAAESGGMLEKGFGHLAEYFRRVDKTRRRILKGLVYPVILLHVAIPVSTFALAVFRAFSLDGNAPPRPYRSAFSEMGEAMLAMYLIAALVVVFAILLHRLARTSGGIDAALNRIPLLGKARRAVALERFTQVFEIFLLAGRKISDSLSGAGKASGSGLLREASDSGAAIVAEGNPLSTALYGAPSAFPNNFARGMAAAEESGQLDRELDEWGRFYSEEAREAMEQVAEWTPKLFYWAILLFVAYLIIRAALAYRDLLMRLMDFSF